MDDRASIAIDEGVFERLVDFCAANDVSATAIVEELLADIEAPERGEREHTPERAPPSKPARKRASRAVDPLDERVIPHVELVRRLAADREANALGDAGGMTIADPARESAIVGPATGTREVCHIHGWVGRHRFEADNHAACDPVGDECTRCNGVGFRTTGSLGCSHCKGTGVEPAKVVFDETPAVPAVPAVPDKVQASDAVRDRTKDGQRHRPKRNRPRAETIAAKRITRAELRAGALMHPPVEDIERPRTRAECPTERPCPFVSCRHHLYLDVNPETGSIKINFPDLEVDELEHSCALDAADLGAHTLEAAGEKLNVTRERLRQLEVKAYFDLVARLRARGIDGASEAYAVGNRPEDA